MNDNIIVLESLRDITKLQIDMHVDEVCFSEDIIKDWEVSSLNEAYNIFLRNIYGDDIETWSYSVQQVYIDGKKYFQVERRNLILEEEQKIVLDLLTDEFGESVVSVWVFWSYITKEDWEYSDFDLVVVLEWYKDSNIYEREKASPRIKRELRESWVKSLFAFNFTTKQELEWASSKWAILVETMAKSFYTIIDKDSFLEKLLLEDRGIVYRWNYIWEWESLNNDDNIKRLDEKIGELETILRACIDYPEYYEHYYEWELVKMKIVRKALTSKNLYVWIFDFEAVCKEHLDLGKHERQELYELYKKFCADGKKGINNYENIDDNIEFSDHLISIWKTLPWLQHRYIALRNILSHLLHRTWNFIIDGEFTQKFLQIFWETLPEDIENDFYECVFKTEQILWRTWYLSFDLDEDGQYIFEQWDYGYHKLIQTIDMLIEYFQESSIQLLDKVWVKETKVFIVSSWEVDTDQFIFPHNIQVITSDELLDVQSDVEYIVRLNSNHSFWPDYILKLLSWFNKQWVKCVTGNRVSLIKGAEAKFSNFAFKREDYEKDWKWIFRHALRSVWTEYFTS